MLPLTWGWVSVTTSADRMWWELTVPPQWVRQGTGIEVKIRTPPPSAVKHRKAYSPDPSASLYPVVDVLGVEVC